jgi:hypothetical protein
VTAAWRQVRLDVRAGVHGFTFEVRRHELVLASEVLVQRCLRGIRFRQEPVDPHRADALLIEQAIGGVKESVAHADCRGFGPSPGFLLHVLTIQTDRSTVNTCE